MMDLVRHWLYLLVNCAALALVYIRPLGLVCRGTQPDSPKRDHSSLQIGNPKPDVTRPQLSSPKGIRRTSKEAGRLAWKSTSLKPECRYFSSSADANTTKCGSKIGGVAESTIQKLWPLLRKNPK
ncbi:hypothetical protein GGR55DRAFT_317182 [Xylaria sp. FL0064]|nr:hypothetical protein GGR55DRAFT_317182 [Xylaria sp. FL0064]